jgi:hypothetical protein
MCVEHLSTNIQKNKLGMYITSHSTDGLNPVPVKHMMTVIFTVTEHVFIWMLATVRSLEYRTGK